METMTYTVLPTDAATTVLTGLFGTLTSNIGPVLALFGVIAGLRFVISRFSAASRGSL